jgi:hypothetical protein
VSDFAEILRLQPLATGRSARKRRATNLLQVG